MVYALIAALVAVAIAHVCLLDRKDKRAHVEREAQRAELQTVLQRVQAPHAAVAAHHATVVPPAAPEDSLPPTDEEIAEMQERDTMIARIEAAENGAVAGLWP